LKDLKVKRITSIEGSKMNYCDSLFSYKRRKTRVVYVGDVGVGGDNPIRVQSMTISDTLNTDAVVEEAKGLVNVGCEIVRITAPTIKHAENLKNIRDKLRSIGIKTPLVADIHFTPNAAMIAADYVEKVRINPGNFADRKFFAVREYTDAEYESELHRLEEKFVPLVKKCKERGVAMRIGTNHGSLSDRIMNRYGDTPLGMVESAFEFVRICEAQDYHDVIFSMKASNPQVMVQAYRLLVQKMNEAGMDYPLHLGVTEAGEGEDGRIKSAIGILALLEDGIGDTIRVSLTEDSIYEIPVAEAMVRKFNKRVRSEELGIEKNPSPLTPHSSPSWNPFEYTRRPSETVAMGPQFVGGKHVVRVQVSQDWKSDGAYLSKLEETIAQLIKEERVPEIVCFRILGSDGYDASDLSDSFLNYSKKFKEKFPKIALGADLGDAAHLFPLVAPAVDKVSVAPSREKNEEGYKAQAIEIIRIAKQLSIGLEWKLEDGYLPTFPPLPDPLPPGERGKEISPITPHSSLLTQLAAWSQAEGFERFGVCWSGSNWIYENRVLVSELDAQHLECVVHLAGSQKEHSLPLTPHSSLLTLLESSGNLGALLLDGIGDSIEVEAGSVKESVHLAYNILQGARQRVTKTEFIACPSCGRTLFDLQTTTARIKKITSHLKGVKIAIMGCIVNGPGEMADADFGYVGGGPNRIHLYVGKECVEKNIPQEEADQRLVELIKKQGRWVEPPAA
jgi:(E)-4-hydroxy-3-methylbut-2-enyl-diphosphate synthase